MAGRSQENLHDHLAKVLDELMKHECVGPFLKAVNPEEWSANDYFDVIDNPEDLGSIRNKLSRGEVSVTKEIFIGDVKCKVKNCITYNGEDHYLTGLALN